MAAHIINFIKNKLPLLVSLFVITFLISCRIGGRSYSYRRYYLTGSPNKSIKYLDDFQFTDVDKEPKDSLLKILKKYSPDAYYLVSRMVHFPKFFRIGRSTYNFGSGRARKINIIYINGRKIKKVTIIKDKGFRRWIDSNAPFDKQIGDMITAVHEINHGYCSRYAKYMFSKRISSINKLRYRYGRNIYIASFDAFYLNKNESLIAVRRTKRSLYYLSSFPSKKIIPLISKKMNIFRLSPYIKNSSRYQSTQIYGISGLIDEYNSYYWSNKVAYDLYNYYKDKRKQNEYTWMNWLRKVASYYFAFTEFRYFILTYLIYAKKYYPRIYKSFITDEKLRYAFTKIDDIFSDLIKKIFHKMFIELPVHLRKFNLKVRVYFRKKKNKIYNIKYRIKNYTTTLMAYYYLPLQRELLKAKYISIANEFRLYPAKPFPKMTVPVILLRK